MRHLKDLKSLKELKSLNHLSHLRLHEIRTPGNTRTPELLEKTKDNSQSIMHTHILPRSYELFLH